jgi:ADP-heptose:LPS heptosyltransferase
VKILIISSNLIGDTILSTGVVNHFYREYPKARFTFLIGASAGQIYNNFPAKEKIILIKKKKFSYHWIEMYIKVYKTKWDLVIDFRSSLISYFLFKKNKYIFKKKKNLNHLDQLIDYFKIKDATLSVITNNAEKIEANNVISRSYKHIILFPGGNWEPKIWPIEYFNKLIHILNDNFINLKFVIVGSSQERKIYYEKIKNNLPNDIFIDLMGKSLTGTSAYMSKCNLFIGNDSGLMHLSVASNLKTIALFGPTNDKIYGHRNLNSFVIRTKERYESFDRNLIDISKSCMHSIKPKDILNFINKNQLL